MQGLIVSSTTAHRGLRLQQRRLVTLHHCPFVYSNLLEFAPVSFVRLLLAACLNVLAIRDVVLHHFSRRGLSRADIIRKESLESFRKELGQLVFLDHVDLLSEVSSKHRLHDGPNLTEPTGCCNMMNNKTRQDSNDGMWICVCVSG